MKEVPLKCFLYSFKEGWQNGERFCFILGSGASVESGIPTGVQLAQRWHDELHEMYTDKELEHLMKKLNIDDITVNSKNYFDIYDLRFYPNYKNGHECIQKLMEKAQPSIGYYPLSKQLAETGNNLVITTNFDCMVEDALFIYTDKRPIVVGHELLASYINVNTKRPIIAKIHRGLYFEPFNRQKELNGLKDQWKDVLKTVFKIYTPIVIGYAGGDNSLMEFLRDNSVEMKGLYWCYYKKNSVTDEIKKLVDQKNGYFVPTDGFDSMMFMLSELHKYPNPSEKISDAAKKRVDMFKNEYEKFKEKVQETNDTDTQELLSSANGRWLKDALERVKNHPNSANAYYDLAYQYQQKQDFEHAIEYYSKAIELNPDDADAYNNRGNVYSYKEEYDKAIADYNKAIEINPEDALVYNNRGVGYSKKGENVRAIADLSKAIALNPEIEFFYENRVEAYELLGETEKTKADMHKVEELKAKKSAK